MIYLITFTAALILEFASTMYISSVASNSPRMIAWAFIGPFLGLPFVAYMVDAPTWLDRLWVALASAIGYAAGSAAVWWWKEYKARNPK